MGQRVMSSHPTSWRTDSFNPLQTLRAQRARLFLRRWIEIDQPVKERRPRNMFGAMWLEHGARLSDFILGQIMIDWLLRSRLSHRLF